MKETVHPQLQLLVCDVHFRCYNNHLQATKRTHTTHTHKDASCTIVALVYLACEPIMAINKYTL